MAIEILTKGTPKSEIKYELRCHDCGTVFTCQKIDMQFHSDQRDGDYTTINCPICSKKVYFYGE